MPHPPPDHHACHFPGCPCNGSYCLDCETSHFPPRPNPGPLPGRLTPELEVALIELTSAYEPLAAAERISPSPGTAAPLHLTNSLAYLRAVMAALPRLHSAIERIRRLRDGQR